MSISNRHQVVPFVAGKSAPLTGQRLAKVGYKSSKQTPAKYKSICVSIPAVQAPNEEQLMKLLPAIGGMIETAQDGIIKSLYESSNGSISTISDEDISIDSCIAFMIAAKAGNRLTNEAIENWFDEELKDNLFVVFAEKLGFTDINEEVEKIVNKHVAGYRGLFSALAGGKTILQEVQCKGLLRALEVSAVDDSMSLRLEERLKGMLEKKPVEEMLML